MQFEDGDSVIVWNRGAGVDGGLFQTSGWHAGLFDLLEKFGLKSSPIREYVMWTTSIPGTYSVSYTVSGSTVTMTGVTTSNSMAIKLKDIEPIAPKDFGKPDKNTRRQWRASEKLHSRNTGRAIGRR